MASSRVVSSRRSFLQLSATAATIAGLRMVTEPMLAHAAGTMVLFDRKDAILLDSNENPLGPSTAAREAIATITPDGGRYRDDLSDELVKLFAQQEGLKTDDVRLLRDRANRCTTPCWPTLRRREVTSPPIRDSRRESSCPKFPARAWWQCR